MSLPFFYRLLADMVVGLHFTFVAFVIFGGLLVIKWRRFLWLHILAVLWGALVEFSGWICPLTPLEVWLRTQAGGDTYRSDFVAHYLLPVLYPRGLTRGMQIGFGILVVVINGAIYSWAFQRDMNKKV